MRKFEVWAGCRFSGHTREVAAVHLCWERAGHTVTMCGLSSTSWRTRPKRDSRAIATLLGEARGCLNAVLHTPIRGWEDGPGGPIPLPGGQRDEGALDTLAEHPG